MKCPPPSPGLVWCVCVCVCVNPEPGFYLKQALDQDRPEFGEKWSGQGLFPSIIYAEASVNKFTHSDQSSIDEVQSLIDWACYVTGPSYLRMPGPVDGMIVDLVLALSASIEFRRRSSFISKTGLFRQD
ncbi:hypothetical protein RRG08_062726 [Elysia crispata]|uniref:Uncharacterized protein n=1 Tax=Elysia crispata TaxID=231223 RepID=A0AAE1DW72_9GAST|nr:hypothetical protein RRG08_062726 [Elysia crispata]